MAKKVIKMQEQIYKVSFKFPPIKGNETKDFYYFCMAAIYDHFTPNQIGCKVTRLWALGVAKGNTYESDTCTIQRVPCYRKRQS